MNTDLDFIINELEPTAPTVCKNARTEIEHLRAVHEAARLFVLADGRGNPPKKYQALKALSEKAK